MPTCFLIPGLGGSTLGRSGGGADPVWVSVQQLAAGQIGRLRLAADGISPGGSDGRQLYAGGVLADYYSLPAAVLAAGLAPRGYTVVPWGYDWRLSARVTAPLLVGAIRAVATPADPCTLVAHSFGGLVARVAWQLLGVAGQQGLVRRIITLGTPHWGSYATVATWSGDSELVAQVALVSLASQYLGIVPGSGVPLGGWTLQAVATVAASWPSLYETLPSLLAPDVGGDPLRGAVYGSGWPSYLGVQTARLRDVVDVWTPYLADPSTMPPPWVLTTVAGRGMPTPYRLSRWQSGVPSVLLASTPEGDGTVPVTSALVDGSARYTIQAAHADLDTAADYAGPLAALVLDPRGPPAPPPPPVTRTNPLVIYQQGPPLPLLNQAGRDC